VGPGQQDLRGAERADAVLTGDQAGGQVLGNGRDLGLDVGSPHRARRRAGRAGSGSGTGPGSAGRRPGGQASPAHARARRSRGRCRSCSRAWPGAVTMTEVSTVRAVLHDCTALSRPAISSRSASRSPSQRSWPASGRASSSLAARIASIGSLLPCGACPRARCCRSRSPAGLRRPGGGPGPVRNDGCLPLPRPGGQRWLRPGPGQQAGIARRVSRHLQPRQHPAARIAQRAAVWISICVSTPIT
jgi:hypothetical protein